MYRGGAAYHSIFTRYRRVCIDKLSLTSACAATFAVKRVQINSDLKLCVALTSARQMELNVLTNRVRSSLACRLINRDNSKVYTVE